VRYQKLCRLTFIVDGLTGAPVCGSVKWCAISGPHYCFCSPHVLGAAADVKLQDVSFTVVIEERFRAFNIRFADGGVLYTLP
jgi:hypothetical protein